MVIATEAAAGAAISHDGLLLFIVQFALLLILARTLGLAAAHFGIPSVVGELLAGLVLGPTVFGALLPSLHDAVFVPGNVEQSHLLEIVSFIGVMLLLVLTGLETDIALILSRRTQALKVSMGGIIVPFVTGFGVALLLPLAFVMDPDQRLTFALFMGTAMSISAIPVIAKVLIEMRVIRRDIGQLTLAAGMVDDTVGWILLSVVAGIAGSGVVSASAVAVSVLTVLGFLVVAFTVGQVVVVRVIRWVGSTQPGEGPLLTTLICLALVFAAVSQALGVEAVLGAFVLGILAGRIRRVDHRIVHTLESITLSVFAPVFFASAGLRVDLRTLADPSVLLVGIVILLVAIGGKFVGAYLGASAAGLGRFEALSLGAGMNARGALEIIVATIGLNLGVLTPEMFTIIVMVAIVTSLMAPPLLRVLLPRVPMGEEERARLEREAGEKSSLLSGVHRVLLPTRGGTNSQLAAQLLQRIATGRDLDVTILNVTPEPGAPKADDRLDWVESQLVGTRVRREVRAGVTDTAAAVLSEAGEGYDLLVIGATETLRDEDPDAPLFSQVVDQILINSPCPVLLVHSRWHQDIEEAMAPVQIGQILLPTAGSDPQSRAPEIAYAIATGARQTIAATVSDEPRPDEPRADQPRADQPRADEPRADEPGPDQAVVDLVRIVEKPTTAWSDAAREDSGGGEDLTGRARTLGEEIVQAEAVVGRRMGATVRTRVEVTPQPLGSTVVDLATSTGADLIVMRSDIQPVTRRAFMGHDLDHILRHAPCPVVIISRA